MKTPETSTQRFVEVADVRGTLVLLRDGSLRSLVAIESINFDLKGNDEQIGIIRGFQDLLNALDFPLQIVVNSRKLDLTAYSEMLQETESKLTNDLLKIQMAEYGRFIKGLAELANIMSKTFFVVVPFHAIEAAKSDTKGIAGKLKDIFASTKHAVKLTDADVEKYQVQIAQRVSVLIAGLTPLGLKAHVLDQQELLGLYYAIYNPGQLLRNDGS